MGENDASPIIVWFRRDLRLADNPALAAATSGRPVIPLYILDETPGIRRPGAASRWWLDKSLKALAGSLEALGSRLVLRRGIAAEVLEQLVAETGAAAVHWNRLYDPGLIERDLELKKALKAEVRSFNASLLTEPWEVQTGSGKDYSVFTPYWRAARTRLSSVETLPAPRRLKAPRLPWRPARPPTSTPTSFWPNSAGANSTTTSSSSTRASRRRT